MDQTAEPRRGHLPAWLWSILPVIATLCVLGVWEVLARLDVLPEQMPPFSDVARWLFNQRTDGDFWDAVWQTMSHWFIGLTLGVVAGVVVGALVGSIPVVQRLLNLPFEFLRPIPSVVYLPLIILVTGVQATTAIYLLALGAFWPMLFQTIYGLRAVDEQVVETGKVFSLSWLQRLRHVVFPSILPFLMTGLRIAASLALVVGVSVELIAGVPGLGSSLGNAQLYGLYDNMYGLLLVMGVLGLAVNLVLERSERRLLRWHVSYREVKP